ncbi:hypothetical protein BKP35_05500 [Anaerobacillus arseniciselenatis]|uniref:DUF3800 domain-containing protein n=1 Tax=Anaerobacillus arseniciselenatis TaxID=85682 RepID=A0A1S2LRQ4_9BACI|nr:DUF3800 domain-containing protein [Anaerobacillus arseniciselenatis]OIJ14890.1 hypothetical protein BKP35_05500 [Anaerobacillus arseniciselenatis]
MKYSIFFDESNKLDAEKKYSYYGAYGAEQNKCEKIVGDIQQILRLTGKKSEYHFTEYNNDKDIAPYLYCLHHFLKTNFQINIFVVDNDIALNYAKRADISVTELRNLFYVKIPERLFYGLTRGLSDDYRTVEIVVDHSPEYGKMRVYSKLKQQMNAHAIYRGMKYYVNKAWYKDSHKSIPLQIVDLFMGIVVFLMEKSYLNIEDDKPIIKSDLIYRFLIEGNNIDLFQKQINIFKWDGKKDIIHEVDISEYLSQFIVFKTQYDVGEMTKISNIKLPNESTKDLRIKLGYTNNQLRMLLGYLDQLNGKGRNTFIMQNYYNEF